MIEVARETRIKWPDIFVFYRFKRLRFSLIQACSDPIIADLPGDCIQCFSLARQPGMNAANPDKDPQNVMALLLRRMFWMPGCFQGR